MTDKQQLQADLDAVKAAISKQREFTAQCESEAAALQARISALT